MNYPLSPRMITLRSIRRRDAIVPQISSVRQIQLEKEVPEFAADRSAGGRFFYFFLFAIKYEILICVKFKSFVHFVACSTSLSSPWDDISYAFNFFSKKGWFYYFVLMYLSLNTLVFIKYFKFVVSNKFLFKLFNFPY